MLSNLKASFLNKDRKKKAPCQSWQERDAEMLWKDLLNKNIQASALILHVSLSGFFIFVTLPSSSFITFTSRVWSSLLHEGGIEGEWEVKRWLLAAEAWEGSASCITAVIIGMMVSYRGASVFLSSLRVTAHGPTPSACSPPLITSAPLKNDLNIFHLFSLYNHTQVFIASHANNCNSADWLDYTKYFILHHMARSSTSLCNWSRLLKICFNSFELFVSDVIKQVVTKYLAQSISQAVHPLEVAKLARTRSRVNVA